MRSPGRAIARPSRNGAQAKAAKAAAAKPLASSNAGGKSIEEVYQKKTQLEHILLRPDAYVGSVERQNDKLWVHDGSRMVLRSVSFVPALYKIFDEILVNAADNKVRDPNMKELRVTVDAAAGSISVWNDGDGVPVEVHKEEKIYVPELIFGHLLTSSNYDDTQKKASPRPRSDAGRWRGQGRGALAPRARRWWEGATGTEQSLPTSSPSSSQSRPATESAAAATSRRAPPRRGRGRAAAHAPTPVLCGARRP